MIEGSMGLFSVAIIILICTVEVYLLHKRPTSQSGVKLPLKKKKKTTSQKYFLAEYDSPANKAGLVIVSNI